MPRLPRSADAFDALLAEQPHREPPITGSERRALAQILAISPSEVTAAHRAQVSDHVAARRAEDQRYLD